MLLPRILTALVGIPFMLWLVHVGSLPFMAFVLAVTILALYEYGLVLEVGRLPVRRWVVVVCGGLLAAGLAVGTPRLGSYGNGLAALGLTLSILAAVSWELFSSERSLDRMALTLFGILFVGWTLPHLFLLRDVRPHGEALTWMLLICVWTMDTAAYIVGKSVGRRPLSSVSPKKTWEGAWAATIVAPLAALAVWYAAMRVDTPAWQAVAAGILIGVLGQMSDLAKSMVKRAAGVKESGYLLPGHGGVLDRFDSFLLACPALYYLVAFRTL